MKIRFLLIGLLVVLSAVCACAQEPARDQAKCYTTWDDSFLYIAVIVDDPDITASHTKPNDTVDGDDSVTVYIDTSGKRPDRIDANCFSMSVSPAGGAQFCAGNSGKLEPKKVFTFKYGYNVQGTMSNSDDIDVGYTIEIAIPWDIIGSTGPAVGDMMALNIVIRNHSGGFVCTAPRVKSEEDILCPAKWAKLAFAPYSFTVSTTDLEKVVSAKYIARAPLINGVLAEKEWHMNTAIIIDISTAAGAVHTAKFPAQKVVLTDYYFWPGVERRKAVAGASPAAAKPDPIQSLQSFPAKNFGPWYGCYRTQTHKDELLDMASAGIDVVMAPSDNPAALAFFASALEELKAEGRPYPRVAMYGMPAGDTGYNKLKTFFDWIPVDFRAEAPAGKPQEGQLASFVYSLADNTSGQEESLLGRIEKELNSPLACVNSKTPSLRVGEIPPADGDNLKKNWDAAFENKSNWIYCRSWNNLQNGNCLCATREQGRKRVDSLVGYVKAFKGDLEYHAEVVRCNMPRIIPGKQMALADIQIKNAGKADWPLSDRIAVGYRWYKDGRYFCESKMRRPLMQEVKAGESITVQVGIATIDMQGDALPNGEYEVRLELFRMSDNKWFSALGDRSLMAPVTVGAVPDWSAGWLTGYAPTLMAVGQNYPTCIRIRNDGSKPWLAGITKLRCNLIKVSASGEAQSVPSKDMTSILDKDCKPGEIATFWIAVNPSGSQNRPLPVWSTDADWRYQLKFDIHNGKQWLSELGSNLPRQNVAVFATDYGPRIVDCSIPTILKAGLTVNAKVLIRNSGAVQWNKQRTLIGYHWYHLDGSELTTEGLTTPLVANVAPGTPVLVNARVTAPYYDGQYALVWDVKIDGVWQAANPLNRGGSMQPVFVEVTEGRLLFMDLSKLFDISAESPSSSPVDGDFDGKGSSFPEEMMPPDISTNGTASRIFPSGYHYDLENHPDGRVSFSYPDQTPGNKTAFTCNGQQLAVTPGGYRAVHILGASVDGNTSGEISISYKGYFDYKYTLNMSDWTTGPVNKEKVGFCVNRIRTKDGDQNKPCKLYHYTIPTDPRKGMTTITLPKNSKMKIMAITLEK